MARDSGIWNALGRGCALVVAVVCLLAVEASGQAIVQKKEDAPSQAPAATQKAPAAPKKAPALKKAPGAIKKVPAAIKKAPAAAVLPQGGFQAILKAVQQIGVIPLGVNSAVPAPEEEIAENVFPPADRNTLKKLSESRELIAEGRFGEAVRDLGEILERPEDFFYQPDKKTPIHESLKAEAQRLIGKMPREGRDLYELQFGARSRRMLDEALESGDVLQLTEVSRRFFHTRAGYQATFLLGLHHFDHGRPLVGALTLQPLRDAGPGVEDLEPALSLTLAACWLRAGMTDKSQETLTALRERYPTLRVPVAGREVPLFANKSEAVDWLVGLIGPQPPSGLNEAEHWLMFRGDATRNASSAGGAPLLNLRWRVTVTEDPLTDVVLDQYQKLNEEQENPIIPTLHPLAVGDVLLMRTVRNLLAVDFLTGKRLWEVPVDEAAEVGPGVPANENQQARQWMLTSGIWQRMWNDMTFGTLSSDGRLVFSIEDVGLSLGAGNSDAVQRFVIRGGMGIVNAAAMAGDPSHPCNMLAAHDIRTGKLKWQIGGPAGPRALPQPNTFFLGPPLPLMGQLYAVAEAEGEIRLLALEASTGNLLWSQPLALAEQNMLQDPYRRWSGASPSFSDGVLVCPTSMGAVVGVDLARQSLLWGFCYGQGRNTRRQNFGMVVSPYGQSSTGRWIDGGVCIENGRVLLTPLESEFIYCLSLADGKLLWKSPRENDLFVASVNREKVVLVGSHAVHALRMKDGKPAWDGRVVSLPENSMPSGCGFSSGVKYFLPLTNAEVLGIDLSAGKIAHVSKSRDGSVPGNLICHQGKIISQAMNGVDAYFQADAVAAEVQRRLASNPKDAEAISLRGEILLDSDKRSEAIAEFRKAYELSPTPRTRELLRDSLLDGLRTDFVTYRNQSEEIERLLDAPVQRAEFLRLTATGLRKSREWTATWECYQKLIDMDPERLPLDQIGKSYLVRRDRWIQGQLAGLRSEAKDEAAAKIDEIVAKRLKAALASDSVDSLRRFFNFFGNQPAAASARGELVRRLKSAGQLLEAELTASSEEPARPDAEAHPPAWPVGKVEVATAPTKNLALGGYNRFMIELQGRPVASYRGLSLQFDQNRLAVVGFDGWGKELWKIPLVEDEQRQNFQFNVSFAQAQANGHFLLLSLGYRLFAIDVLKSGSAGAPRLLWTQDLSSPGLDSADFRQLPMNFANMPWQLRQRFYQTQNRPNFLKPNGNNYVCFQRLRNLAAVDPRNGETLWSRQDFPAGCDLFGDEQYVFVLAPDREEATLLRALDGELLGTRKVPRSMTQLMMPNGEQKKAFARLEENCLATLGRNLLLWRPDENGFQRLLTLFDPLEGRDLWPARKFEANAHACVLDEKVVAIMEPNGRFVLVSLPDGRTIADQKLQEEPNLMEITLMESGDNYYLLTNTALASANPPNIQPMPGNPSKPIYKGRLYCLDHQGKPQWPAPVAIKNQFLLANQPENLPLFTFASQIFVQNFNGGGQYKASILCVDKRNGQKVYKKSFPNQTGIFNVAGDAEKKTVDLTMHQTTITLTYTDKPIPPPSAEKPKSAKSTAEGKAVLDLWNGIQKTIGLDADESDSED